MGGVRRVGLPSLGGGEWGLLLVLGFGGLGLERWLGQRGGERGGGMGDLGGVRRLSELDVEVRREDGRLRRHGDRNRSMRSFCSSWVGGLDLDLDLDPLRLGLRRGLEVGGLQEGRQRGRCRVGLRLAFRGTGLRGGGLGFGLKLVLRQSRSGFGLILGEGGLGLVLGHRDLILGLGLG